MAPTCGREMSLDLNDLRLIHFMRGNRILLWLMEFENKIQAVLTGRPSYARIGYVFTATCDPHIFSRNISVFFTLCHTSVRQNVPRRRPHSIDQFCEADELADT